MYVNNFWLLVWNNCRCLKGYDKMLVGWVYEKLIMMVMKKVFYCLEIINFFLLYFFINKLKKIKWLNVRFLGVRKKGFKLKYLIFVFDKLFLVGWYYWLIMVLELIFFFVWKVIFRFW